MTSCDEHKKSFCFLFSEEEEDEKPRPSFKNFSKGAVVEGEIAGLRKRTINTALINKGVGDWERHTKGIGAKLLLQVLHIFILN